MAVFCPTSNLFLGSGLFDYQRYRQRTKPLRIATATDVGGGTNYSMLRTMDEGYKVIALNGEKLNPFASFWQMTRGNAEALSLADGSAQSRRAPTRTSSFWMRARRLRMKLRMETVETLAEELFLLQTMGDDRSMAGKSISPEGRRRAILHDEIGPKSGLLGSTCSGSTGGRDHTAQDAGRKINR